jgi:hypothetical protein
VHGEAAAAAEIVALVKLELAGVTEAGFHERLS